MSSAVTIDTFQMTDVLKCKSDFRNDDTGTTCFSALRLPVYQKRDYS